MMPWKSIIFKHWYVEKRNESHLQDEDQQGGADEQRDQAANEPAQPQDPIIQSHNPHGLL